MKVKLKKDFKCAPEGHTTLSFKEGEEVQGRVAELAIRTGAADKPKGKSTPKPTMSKPAQPEIAKAPKPEEEG